MVVYGRNAVREALRGRRAASVSDVLVAAGLARERWLEGVPHSVVDAVEIERACGSPEHQGVCATLNEFPYVGAAELLGDGAFILALDEVQDPQNLGAICRTAECVGVTGVVICERRAAGVTPAVCGPRQGRSSTCGCARAKPRGLPCRGQARRLLVLRRGGR
jgi:23S rRNA (guanosine2251-2'-O)-methyltransferase